ncbi:hypothetical protein EJ110_NYTH26138 [Nymphaea thermarum]|nr:hypothetical protein EJ110_NYTH26138 [Nymphaea thermarum]
MEEDKLARKNWWISPKLEGLITSCKNSIENVFQSHIHRRKSNPIEILKRLQREAFADLMKLRDRQDKLESILMLYKSSKASPFEETATHIKGEVSACSLLLMKNGNFEHAFNMLDGAGVRTGVDAKFTFDTILRKKDALITQLVAAFPSLITDQDALGSTLSLRKVMYLANITDWFSFIAIPFGARCEDIGVLSKPHGFTLTSSSVPPIFSLDHSCAAGIMLKRSKVAVSLAELFCASGGDQASLGCHSTLGQLFCELSEGNKFGLSFLCQRPSSLTPRVRLVPLGLKRHAGLSMVEGNSDPAAVSMQSIALMVESGIDETARVNGWIEMQKCKKASFQWAVSFSDCPEDEMGWGISVGQAMMHGSSHLTREDSEGNPMLQFQLEAFLKFPIGKKFTLQPGFVYAIDQNDRTPALLLRSNWSF